MSNGPSIRPSADRAAERMNLHNPADRHGSHFDEGQARYEAVGERHHDHFICERCGRIIEFENAAIERMQNIVARDLGVTLTRHKMELYGICSDCHAQQQGM